MTDTSPEFAEVYRKLLMKKSGTDRLKMASGMFDAARMLVKANLQDQYVTDKELDWQIFLRLYKQDFDPPTLDKIHMAFSQRR